MIYAAGALLGTGVAHIWSTSDRIAGERCVNSTIMLRIFSPTLSTKACAITGTRTIFDDGLAVMDIAGVPVFALSTITV